MSCLFVQVVLDTPLDFCFDYRYPTGLASARMPQVGQLVVVPFGRRTEVGLIVDVKEDTDVEENRLKDVIEILSDVPPLNAEWMALCRFAAGYYQRPLGEVALPAIPKKIRTNGGKALERAWKALEKQDMPVVGESPVKPQLHTAQQHAVDAIVHSDGFSPYVLYGVTGSGKTEIYLHSIEVLLRQKTDAQVLVMVPEINLTPQLEKSVRERFPRERIATLHSRLTET